MTEMKQWFVRNRQQNQQRRGKRNRKRNRKRKQKPRNNNRWTRPVTTTRRIQRLIDVWEVTEYLFKKEIARLQNHDKVFMAAEDGYEQFDKSTFIADTGASTHMVNSDDGMYDCKEIEEPIILCNGKKMMATKIGKVRMTALQVDGSTADVVLQGVKFVPGLDMNLFSVM